MRRPTTHVPIRFAVGVIGAVALVATGVSRLVARLRMRARQRELEALSVPELYERAAEQHVEGRIDMPKEALVDALL